MYIFVIVVHRTLYPHHIYLTYQDQSTCFDTSKFLHRCFWPSVVASDVLCSGNTGGGDIACTWLVLVYFEKPSPGIGDNVALG